MNENRIELGDEVQDTISGFTGVAICVSRWLYGCRRIVVAPRELKDGKLIEAQAFDEPQLLLVKKHVIAGFDGQLDEEAKVETAAALAPQRVEARAPHGDRPDPPARRDVTRR